jgi:methyl-accepting chemotaxis protein WspA
MPERPHHDLPDHLPDPAAQRFPRRGSIERRLLGWFLGLALGSVLLVAVVGAVVTQRNLEGMIRGQLETIAESRAVLLEELVTAQVMAVSGLSREPALIAALAGPADTAPSAEALAFLSHFAGSMGFSQLLLVDRAGRVRGGGAGDPAALLPAGTDLAAPPWRGGPLATAVDRARTLLQTDLSAPQPLPGRRRGLFVAGPLLDGARVAGTLVGQIDEAMLDAAMAETSGLGRSGQVVAVHAEGEALLVAAPLRGDPAAAGTRRIARSSPQGEAFHRTLRGEAGAGIGVGLDGQPVIAAWFHLPTLRWALSVQKDTAEAFAPARRLALTMLLLAAMVTVPVVFVARRVAAGLSQPIQTAAGAAVRVSEGDLSRQIEVAGQGEVRTLLAAVSRMIGDLSARLLRIRSAGREVLGAAEAVRATATAQQAVVNDLSGSTAQIAAAISEMSATGRQLAAASTAVAESATETAERAASGQEALGRLREAIAAVADATRSVCATLAEIRERADGVDRVIAAITRIASRTNLLSINATIEAEKAGAHGRGFRVVASEVNRLADQTAAAALEVEEIISGLRHSVSSGTAAMQGLEGVVAEGVGTAESIGGDLSGILGSVQLLGERFTELREGISAQSEGASQISDAMSQVTRGSGETRAAVERLLDAGTRLEQAAETLGQAVEGFRLAGS